jgi:hypothetical protein
MMFSAYIHRLSMSIALPMPYFLLKAAVMLRFSLWGIIANDSHLQ